MLLASPAAAPAILEDLEAGALGAESPSPESPKTLLGSPFAQEPGADADDATVAGEAQESDDGSGGALRLEEEGHTAQLEAAVKAALLRLEELERFVVARPNCVAEYLLQEEFELACEAAYGLFEKLAAGVAWGHQLAAARGRVNASIVELWAGIQQHNSRLGQHHHKAYQFAKVEYQVLGGAAFVISLLACFAAFYRNLAAECITLGILFLLMAVAKMVTLETAIAVLRTTQHSGAVPAAFTATEHAAEYQRRREERQRIVRLFDCSTKVSTWLHQDLQVHKHGSQPGQFHAHHRSPCSSSACVPA